MKSVRIRTSWIPGWLHSVAQQDQLLKVLPGDLKKNIFLWSSFEGDLKQKLILKVIKFWRWSKTNVNLDFVDQN